MSHNNNELDVAIIGMAGRFPGAKNIDMFWENLVNGRESITFMSDKELLQEGVDAALLKNPNYVRAASILDNEDVFDAEFFGYSGLEADRLDPQSRLFLECAWEALECAGYAPLEYAGPVGVFASQSMNTYLLRNLYSQLTLDEFILSYQNIQRVVTNLGDFLATRVSYKLNLKGPSINVQCACSSSLVAVHLACQSLINGECEMALAGGVSLYLPQRRGYLYEEGMILSPDGHCRAFDADAKGTVFGRGVGIVVLKPFQDAVDHGDAIYAVIKGSAINNDGASKVGFTAPSVEGQARVIAEALTVSGVGAETISYVEAHGTGTAQGDPIEVAALTQVFRNYTDRNGFCALGTVKSNFGHLDAAAGITGLIKTALMLQNKKVPPSLHYRNPNPQIDFERSPFYVCHELQEWETSGDPRRAGVSAFGMGGTNAHVIVEEPPEPTYTPRKADRPAHVLTLSAKNEKALKRLVERYVEHLDRGVTVITPDICFTAGVGRSHFDHRLAVIADTNETLCTKLAAFNRGDLPAGVHRSRQKARSVPRLTFLFTGQGSQSVGMGRQLYQTQPTFRKALDKCDELLRGRLDKPLLAVLYPQPGEESPLNETAYTQPALFALEYALYELWRSWGVEPSVVMGHSVGEYVAACVAGVFSLEDGIALIAERGRLIQALPKTGEMAAVFASEDRVAAAIAGHTDKVSVAVVNGPENTVISGERESIGRILKELEAEGIVAQRLNVSHAFHSPLMEPMLDAFEQAASKVAYSLPRVSLMSNITGRLVAGDEVSNPGYWRRHVRAPVQFYRSMQALHERGEGIFLELGPHPVLLGMGAQCLPKGEEVWLPSLRRGQDEWQQMLESLGELYVRGMKVRWKGFDGDYRRQRVRLPAYPFEAKRHWIDPPEQETGKLLSLPRSAQRLGKRHPLLGSRLRTPKPIYETELSVDTVPWIPDYRVHDQALLPISAYMEMALAASSDAFGEMNVVLKNVCLEKKFILPEKQTRTAQLLLTHEEGQIPAFEIYNLKADGGSETNAWGLLAKGQMCIGERGPSTGEVKSLAEIARSCHEEVFVDAHHKSLEDRGLSLGTRFHVLTELRRGRKEALGRFKVPELVKKEMGSYRIHPALLEGCLQVTAAVIDGEDVQRVEGGVYLPERFESFRVLDDVSRGVWSYAAIRTEGHRNGEILADVYILDDLGRVLVEVVGLGYRCISSEGLLVDEEKDFASWLYKLDWKQVPRPSQSKRLSIPADFLPPLSQISESINPELDRLADQCDLDVYVRMAARFNALCVGYIVNAFRKLGFEFKLNDGFTTDSLVGRLGIVSRHHKLAGRFLEVLAKADIITRDGEGWRVIQTPRNEDPQELWHTLSREYTSCRHELGFVAQTGMYLAESLRGEIDPLQLLFPKGDLSTSEKLYQESVFARVFNTLVQKAVTASLANLPEGRRVRIIEIGGGTGGTTSFILPHLPESQVEYVFTDISAMFLEKARNKFTEYPFVRYEIFDVEKDPAQQGIGPQRFDIVIAANVIHATRDLMESLSHINRLLAPGGLLVSLEVTGAQFFADVTVGLLEGWWRFSDHNLRPSYPLISENQWIRLMGEAGFCSAVSVPEISRSEGNLSQHAVFLARTPESLDEVEGIGSLCSALQGENEWMIFADRQGLGEKLAEQIKAKNGNSTLVFAGDEYRADHDRYIIDPGKRDDAFRLLTEVSRNRQRPLTKIVHLWALDAGPLEETTLIQLRGQEQLLCGSVLHVVQALARLEDGVAPSLLLVTRGSQAPVPASGLSHPESSTLWGLGRVIAREHPQLQCVCIDLDQSDEGKYEEDLEAISEEALLPDGETQVAYRNRVRYGARLAPYLSKEGNGGRAEPVELFEAGRFSPDATYLITGGLGGLGLLFAQWMTDRGARHLILMGRNAPSQSAQKALEHMERDGAQLVIAQGDVSRETDIAQILENSRQSAAPLRGVLHCAGVLEDGVLLKQDWDRFEKVFAPKVFGSFNLHTLTQNMELDFFVLFSSVASLLGLAGQGNHAAANAFMDSLAGYRRARGLPAISINWGPWSGVGAATKGNIIERIESQGMEVISPKNGLRIFELVLQEAPSEVAVGRMHWDRFLGESVAGAIPPIFSDVLPGALQREKEGEHEPSPKQDFGKQLAGTPKGRRRSLLLAHVAEQVRRGLRLDNGKSIDPQQPLSELGLDSLLAIELRNRIGLSLGLSRSLPATMLFDYPTVDAITNYLAEEVLSIDSPKGLAGSETEDKLLNEIGLLSDAEAETLLLAEMSAERKGN